MWKRYKEVAAGIERDDPLPSDYITQLQEAIGDTVEGKATLSGAVGRAW
jgi:hypothetical protein